MTLLSPKDERHECDQIVAMLIAQQPTVLRLAIEARNSSNAMGFRKERLAEAIREAELLAAFLRDRQRRLGWHDERSDAA